MSSATIEEVDDARGKEDLMSKRIIASKEEEGVVGAPDRITRADCSGRGHLNGLGTTVILGVGHVIGGDMMAAIEEENMRTQTRFYF